MSAPPVLAVLALGAVAGFLGGMLGLGGGILMVPVLHLFFHVPIHQAVAVSLAAILATSAAGPANQPLYADEAAHWGVRLGTFAVIGGATGGWLAGFTPAALLGRVFAVLLLGAAAWVGLGPQAREGERLERRGLAWGSALVGGVLSGLVGVGGGILQTPVWALPCKLGMKRAAALSNFVLGLTALAALTQHLHGGRFRLDLAAPLAAGAMVGSWGSSRILPGSSVRLLQVAFAVVLAVTGARMLWGTGW